MAKNNNLTDFLTSLANKIRNKLGSDDLINPQDFEDKIDSIYAAGSDDAHNEFWEMFQNGGGRRDYTYAFRDWQCENISPKYPIIANDIQYMFMNCKELAYADNIQITCNALNPSMMGLCMNNIHLVTAPEIEFPVSNITRVWTSAFAGCVCLETAEVYLGSGDDSDGVSVRNQMQNTFFKCTALENLTFSGKGSPLYLDLSYSSLLTIESVISLVNALIDVSGAQSGVYNIKISPETNDIITEHDESESFKIRNKFTELGWTLEEVSHSED